MPNSGMNIPLIEHGYCDCGECVGLPPLNERGTRITQADVQRYVRVLAQRDRLAQTLRLLRDTSNVGSYPYNAAVRALKDAEIAEPEDEDHP